MAGMEILDVVFVYQLKTPELVRWHSRSHSHNPDEHELHYFIGGTGHFRKERERYVIEPGSLYYSPPLEHHSVRPGDFRRPISYYAVLFRLEGEAELLGTMDTGGFIGSFPRSVGSRYRVLFEDLKNWYTHANPARRRSAGHMLLSLLWELAAESGVSGADRARSGEYNVHISRAIGIFERHVTERITIGEVAAMCEVTQAHLTRLFTKHFGVSPLQYYQRLRMDVAASLLLNTNRSIKEISFDMGYSNPFHFSRSFSRYADMSPRVYREQYFRANPTQYESKVLGGPG